MFYIDYFPTDVHLRRSVCEDDDILCMRVCVLESERVRDYISGEQFSFSLYLAIVSVSITLNVLLYYILLC